ncbi:MAG: Sip1-related alpha-galactosidase [bacterium]
MRRNIIALFGAVAFIVAAMSTPVRCGEAMKVNVNPANNTFELTVGDIPLASGLYPELSTFQDTFSASNGGLKVSAPAAPEKGRSKLGDYEEWILPYSDITGAVVIRLKIRSYPEMSAAAIGYDYEGAKALRPEKGMKLFIGELPGFVKGMGSERYSQFWTRPAFAVKPEAFPSETQYMLWGDKAFKYGVAIPLVGGGMKSSFMPEGGKLTITQSSYDAGFKPKSSQEIVFAWGADPYKTTHSAYKVGMEFMGNPGRLREEKKYPEVFDYFGWCSWNAYYSNITQDKIAANARSFKEHKFPVRFFVVDDGWQSEKDRMLTGFDIKRDKFPDGIDGLVTMLKKEYGITWVGFWHAFQGYWNGVNPNSPLAKEYKDSLFKSITGGLIPNPIDGKGFKFYDAYHAKLRAAGADMVKVDNQSTMIPFSMNKIPIAYAMRGQQANLQASVNRNFDGAVINCMDMTIENVYCWKDSNVSRNSDDFYPSKPDSAAIHALHNIYNSMWFSELAFPDFDMFQSHHPQGKMHSVLRAISGGPVYCTDTAGQENWNILWKMVFSDGRIPRPDNPARPTRDVLLSDPTKEKIALKAFTNVGGAGVVAAFNVDMFGRKVDSRIAPADVEGIKGNSFAIYDHFSEKLKYFKSRDEEAKLTINSLNVKLFIITPVENGFAAIGALNKYISPKWINGVNVDSKKIDVGLKESCVFGAFIDKAPVKIEVDGNPLDRGAWKYDDNLLRIELPESIKTVKLTIFR